MGFFIMTILMNDKEYLRDFFERAPIGFHAFGEDQKIIDINDTELLLLGYSREEVVGKLTWSDLIIEEHREKFKEHWKDILKKGRVTNLEYTMVCKDGTYIHVLLNATARFDKKGKLINTRGSVVDITERRELNLKLQENQRVMKNNIRSLQKIIQNMEKDKSKIQENIEVGIRKSIYPLIDKIKQRDDVPRESIVVDLENNLAKIIGGMGSRVYNSKWNLSAREIEICFLVQSQLSTKEIAELLCSSTRTIDNHRNHIRKKLGISKKSVDLGKYLENL